jgi:hypothetical protein
MLTEHSAGEANVSDGGHIEVSAVNPSDSAICATYIRGSPLAFTMIVGPGWAAIWTRCSWPR